MILDQIVANRAKQLGELQAKKPLSVLAEEAFQYSDSHKAMNFAAALKKDRISIISEVKKASPSKGVIQEDFDPLKTAAGYLEAGADAISVLTEETYFQGSGAYLEKIRKSVPLPLLRKDFMFTEWQLCEARLLGADAVLLITAVLDVFALKKLIGVAQMLGMQSLVEVHSEEEVATALRAGAEIIGINNRNLKTFEVDLRTTEKLRRLIPPEIICVSESGIRDAGDVRRLREIGVDAVLIGETLMRSDDVKKKMAELRG